jgi:hypothetical protein
VNVCRPCLRGQHHRCMGWCPCDELHVGATAPRPASPSHRTATARTSTSTTAAPAGPAGAAAPTPTAGAEDAQPRRTRPTEASPADAGPTATQRRPARRTTAATAATAAAPPLRPGPTSTGDGPAGIGVTGAQIREATGITLDALTRWCAGGVFGPDQVNHRSGRPRRYTAIDVAVAAACLRLSDAVSGGPGGGAVAVLRQVADQVRLGHRHLHIQLDPYVTVTVDIEDLDRRPGEAHDRTPVEVGRRPCGRCQAPDALGELCGHCQLAGDAGTATTREAS